MPKKWSSEFSPDVLGTRIHCDSESQTETFPWMALKMFRFQFIVEMFQIFRFLLIVERFKMFRFLFIVESGRSSYPALKVFFCGKIQIFGDGENFCFCRAGILPHICFFLSTPAVIIFGKNIQISNIKKCTNIMGRENCEN